MSAARPMEKASPPSPPLNPGAPFPPKAITCRDGHRQVQTRKNLEPLRRKLHSDTPEVLRCTAIVFALTGSTAVTQSVEVLLVFRHVQKMGVGQFANHRTGVP